MAMRGIIVNDQGEAAGHLRMIVEDTEKRRKRVAFSCSLFVKGDNR
jgi:hypothetical protein